MKERKFVIKIKVGHKEGIGDLTSSLSIAQQLRRNKGKVFFILNRNRSARTVVSRKGFACALCNTINEVRNILKNRHFDVAILNQLKSTKQEALLFKARSKVLVTVDDNGTSSRFADLRFNTLYPIKDSYFDFKYMPLNKQYQKKHRLRKIIKINPTRILITQGGSDTYGFTPKIIKSLYGIPATIKIDVILGPYFSANHDLNQVLSDAPRAFTIIRKVNDPSEIMLKADLAITAGGFTLFELACLGVPAIVVCGESFEAKTARRLERLGFGINLGFGANLKEEHIFDATRNLVCDRNLRCKMSRIGKRLVDGRGAQRIAMKILQLSGNKSII